MPATTQRQVIDTNVSLFRWPFRRLPLDEAGQLADKLRKHGIGQAWAGSFEGLLHDDVAGVNARLAAACELEKGDRLIPFGTVNPRLPDWEEDLRRCHEEHHMPGIRLYPNYHGYPLDDPRFAQLLRTATERKMIVQLAASMEDRRTQHPMLQVPDVDLAPLPQIIKAIPNARLVILNHKATGAVFHQLLALPNVYVDTARVPATDGVARLLGKLPPGRVVFGTHAPFLIYEAAMIKVAEANVTAKAETALLFGNANKLLTENSK